MVSILIVSYNTKNFIIPCIQSIERFAPKGTEVIVVDNSSTDGSLEELKAQSAKLKTTTQELKLIENSKNLGYAKAVNLGIKASSGEYIFILNPDTKLTKDTIDKLLEYALLRKNLGIIAPKLLNPDGSLQASCFNEPTLFGAIKEYFFGIKGTFEKYAPKGDKPVEVDAVVGAAMFIPRTVVDKVGMFDERYFMYFEDLDYCRRVRHAGFAVCYLPKSKVIHAHGGVTKTVREKARQWLIESSIVYHGAIGHTLLTTILWLGQKWQKLFWR